MLKIFGALLAFFISLSASAKTECPAASTLDPFFTKAGVYIGELHGSNESPEFVLCVVDSAIERRLLKPIVVSLELPDTAKNPEYIFWLVTDGRSSQAMWALVQKLIGYESAGKISLHFQETEVRSPGTSYNKDVQIAAGVRQSLEIGFVIAYGGNVHNMKQYPPGLKVDFPSAAMLLGDRMLYVRLGAIAGGEIWAKQGDPIVAGPMQIAKTRRDNVTANALYEDQNHNHDFVWYLPEYTMSPPKQSQQ